MLEWFTSHACLSKCLSEIGRPIQGWRRASIVRFSALRQLSGPQFATKPRAELASIDKTQHIWLALRALRTDLTKTTAGHDGADCGDLLSRLVTKHKEYSSPPAADKNKARLMDLKWWYGGRCRLQNIYYSPISNIKICLHYSQISK